MISAAATILRRDEYCMEHWVTYWAEYSISIFLEQTKKKVGGVFTATS